MNGKVAYVTGGMGGIGTAICQRLARAGFTVIAGCGPNRDFDRWLREQADQGFTFYASVGNVSDWDSTVEAFAKVKAQYGPVDVRVNNAGITRDNVFRKMTREEWRAVIDGRAYDIKEDPTPTPDRALVMNRDSWRIRP